jgi:hypothetical protein
MSPLFRFALVVLATLVALGRYLQEARRLSIIKRLPGAQARDFYERTRQNNERSLLVLSVGLVAAAIAAVVYTFVLPR